jgi:hypothetical protein
MDISRFNYRVPAFVGLCMSVCGCVPAVVAAVPLAAFAAIPAAALSPTEPVAVPRASRELNCPSQRITVVERDDISPGLYDVGACGRRARYHCFGLDAYYPAEPFQASVSPQCTREPDPERWDPDPTMFASLPPRPGSKDNPDGNVRRICGDGHAYRDCLYRDHGQWRWWIGTCAPTYSAMPGLTTTGTSCIAPSQL